MTPLPEPNEQHLQSVKYVAQAVCCVPTTDPNLWGVFVGLQASRDLLGIMTSEELLAYLRHMWQDDVVQHEMRKRTARNKTPTVSAKELDDILADLIL